MEILSLVASHYCTSEIPSFLPLLLLRPWSAVLLGIRACTSGGGESRSPPVGLPLLHHTRTPQPDPTAAEHEEEVSHTACILTRGVV